MADLEDRYYEVVSDGCDSQSATSRRWFKVSAALVGGSGLLVLCIATTFLFTYELTSKSAAESIRLFNLPTSKTGFATGQIHQGKVYQQGLRPFVQNLPNLWRPRTSVQNKAATAEAPGPAELSPFERISRIAGAAGSLGYLKLPSPFKAAGKKIEPQSVIWSPTVSPVGVKWSYLDDKTFGGNSESSFDVSTGVWTGTAGIAPGFASIRTPILQPPLDLTDCSGIRMKVKGQGQRLKFLLRDDEKFNGVSWSYAFNTNPWFDTEVKIKFDDFAPVKDAQSQKSVPLDVASITVLQLIFSKFEYNGKPNPSFKTGDFQVVIKEISTF